MPDIIGALIGTKYADKRREDEYKHQTYGPIIHDYMTNPQTAVDDGVADYAAKSLMGIMGKDERKNFQAFWDTIKHGKQIAGQQAAASQPPQQFPSGSPAPQAAATPVIPAPPSFNPDTGSVALNYGGMPFSVPPPPSQASADSSLAADAPIPGIDRGGPALGPRMASAPSEGYTSLGIGNNPALDQQPSAPSAPPAQEFLRNGRGMMRALGPQEMYANYGEPLERAKARVGSEITAQQREAAKQWLEKQPWYQKLSPRQQAIVVTQQPLTPELRPQNIPQTFLGKDLPPGTTIAGDEEKDDKGVYRLRAMPDNTFEAFRVIGHLETKHVIDEKSPTGWAYVTRDSAGNETARMPAPPNPAFVPTTTSTANSSSAPRVLAVGDKMVVSPPITTTRKSEVTTSKKLPGQTATPIVPIPAPPGTAVPAPVAAPAAPAATAPARPSAPSMKVLGETPAAWKMRMENQLTPEGQKFMTATDTTLDTVNRVEAMLKQHQKEKGSSRLLLPQIAYSLGFKGGESELLGALSMGSIIEGGRVMAPTGSRARTILEKSMLHTPDAWKDSVPLMLDKLTAVKKSLTESRTQALKYYQRYPGLTGGQTISAPPGQRAEDYLQSIGHK